MFDDSAHTQAWARRVLDEHLRPAVHRRRQPLQVRAWMPEQGPDDDPVGVAAALAARYEPVEPGQAWGAPWTTWWFELTGLVPPEFAGERVEVVIDLGFATGAGPGFQAEGLLYDPSGTPLKGVHPANRWFQVAEPAAGSEPVHLFLEAAANPTILSSFRPTPLGHPRTAGTEPLYRLGAIDLAVLDRDVFALVMDLDVLLDLAAHLPDDSTRRLQLLAAVSDAMDALDTGDVPGTAAAVRAGLAETLAAPAVASSQQLTAVAHAHIDSAWLWPIRETRRKCARTFANVTALAADYPELVFACSSAQQYRWIRDEQPAIWQRIRDAVRAGNWEPVGGMWVEPDGMVPSGESLARQLLLGQRFFAEEFGQVCSGMWLPDSFGYNAAYPQIAALGGTRWFLTQKISWNDTNTFPHHTFWWEGLDGTRILTHFPPADTYNADLGGADLHRSAAQHRERARSRKALVPFGFGDGGGGPEREMLERARRLGSLEGSPRVSLGRAEDFFDGLAAEYGDHAPTWSGELYLELHRGTLTSQRAMKVGNRHCESALRQAELIWTMVAVADRGDYPAEELRDLWEQVLLLQFHDILPGSSIAWVHEQARADYARMLTALDGLIDAGLRRLTPRPSVFNAAPFDRRELVELADGPGLVEVGSLSLAPATRVEPQNPVKVAQFAPSSTQAGASADLPTGVHLSNALVSVEIAPDGTLASLIDHRHGDREVLAAGRAGAELRLHPDVPLQWDAWDLDRRHANTWQSPVSGSTPGWSSTAVTGSQLRTVVETRSTIGASPLVVRVALTADSPRVDVEIEIDWRERDKTLACYLPVSVLAREASADIQFGHVHRPTHENTSWEAARFEVVAHRWLHVGDTSWGTAIVNDGVYGHSVRRERDGDGRPATTVRLTLLRSARFPDPDADAGQHLIRFGIVPGADVAEAIQQGYAVNLPARLTRPTDQPCDADPSGSADRPSASTWLAASNRSGDQGTSSQTCADPATPVVAVDDPAAVVEAVKLAEDGSGDVILRLYESLGGSRTVTLTPGFPVERVHETDLLEDPDAASLSGRRALIVDGAAIAARNAGSIHLQLKPFQIVTLRLSRA